MIFGSDGMSKLFGASVAIFGIGGVGGYVVEALARSGVGKFDLFDHDIVCLTNINRQIHATWSSLGRYKVEVAKERILDINPNAEVNAHRMFFTPDLSTEINFAQYDYVIDAIDTVSGKIELAVKTHEAGVNIISSMGAGNKAEATAFEVADIYSTSVCPLAKVMRYELRKRGVTKLKVVYSKEPPIVAYSKEPPIILKADAPMRNEKRLGENCVEDDEENNKEDDKGSNEENNKENNKENNEEGDKENNKENNERSLDMRDQLDTTKKGTRKKQIPSSNSFVPAVVGLIIAGEVVKDITGYNNRA